MATVTRVRWEVVYCRVTRPGPVRCPACPSKPRWLFDWTPAPGVAERATWLQRCPRCKTRLLVQVGG